DRPGGEILTAEGRSIRISAWDNRDLDRLKDEMDDMLFAAQIHGLAEIPVSRGEMISHCYQKAEAVHSEADALTLQRDVRLPLRRFGRMSPEVQSFIRRVY